jgi:hypothetical protein
MLVDNASTDGSPGCIQRRFPEVKVILNAQNAGFARANNQGIRGTNGPYVLLLNPDTEVKPEALDRLISYLDEHPDAGVAGPYLLNPDGSLQSSCYPFPTLAREIWRLLHLDWMLHLGTYDQDHWDTNQPREVDSLQGACMLIRRDVLDRVGLLDEDFFIYTEEIDLCYRIQQAGWKLYWLPQAQVIHYGGQSTRQVASRMFIQLYHSKIQYFRKHYGRFQAWIYKLILLFAGSLRIILAPLALFENQPQRKKHLDLARSYFRLILAIPGL